ncbi:hypothetical protein [Chroococcus sp. FPU101]|uniref:hypothetical protein n=1 Tax=Chroococcus sp. FPU101 TaxID=1974212 RepID=UPI001A8C4FB4|nr:hypothetical protein [Chroococcus sp. FPU101]
MTKPITRRIFLETGAALAVGLLSRLEGAFKNQSINFDSSRHGSLTRRVEHQVNLIEGEVTGLVK